MATEKKCIRDNTEQRKVPFVFPIPTKEDFQTVLKVTPHTHLPGKQKAFSLLPLQAESSSAECRDSKQCIVCFSPPFCLEIGTEKQSLLL